MIIIYPLIDIKDKRDEIKEKYNQMYTNSQTKNTYQRVINGKSITFNISEIGL